MDQVEEDLKRMKIIGWTVKAEDREEWSRIVEQTTQGCRVDSRRRRIILKHNFLPTNIMQIRKKKFYEGIGRA
jgi:hypothetical protein